MTPLSATAFALSTPRGAALPAALSHPPPPLYGSLHTVAHPPPRLPEAALAAINASLTARWARPHSRPLSAPADLVMRLLAGGCILAYPLAVGVFTLAPPPCCTRPRAPLLVALPVEGVFASRALSSARARCAVLLELPLLVRAVRRGGAATFTEWRIARLLPLWLLLDGVGGVLLGVAVLAAPPLALPSHHPLSIPALRAATHWLLGLPGGLKLNHFLAARLGGVVLAVLDAAAVGWAALSTWATPLSPLLRPAVACLCGVGGVGVAVGAAGDAVALSFLHVTLLHQGLRALHRLHWACLRSLWRMFRGVKQNLLRVRVDDLGGWLDPRQLVLGSLGLTLSAFLAPTLAAFYAVFAVAAGGVAVLQWVLAACAAAAAAGVGSVCGWVMEVVTGVAEPCEYVLEESGNPPRLVPTPGRGSGWGEWGVRGAGAASLGGYVDAWKGALS